MIKPSKPKISYVKPQAPVRPKGPMRPKPMMNRKSGRGR